MTSTIDYALDSDLQLEVDAEHPRVRERLRWKQGYKTGHHVQAMKTIHAINDLRNSSGYVSAEDLLQAIRLEWTS